MAKPNAYAERLEAVHELAERVTIVLTNVPSLRDLLERLRYFPGLPPDGLNELAEALRILDDVDRACRGSVALFDRLRRVV